MSTTAQTIVRPTDKAVVVGTPADKGLLIIRIAAAIVFLFHGSSILFGAFGGPGLAGFAGYMHMPIAVAALVGLAQFCGGIALLLGLFARIGAACIVIVMLGAIFLVHLPHGFDVSKGGMEFAFTQFMIALAVLIDGPGIYAVGAKAPGVLRNL